MLFYIDYLDYELNNESLLTSTNISERLRFDLLVFSSDTLCVSVPSCIKLQKTTEVLVLLDAFWKNGKIKLQLDKKHRYDARNYFMSRKGVLEKNITEDKLRFHFEYTAYTHARTSNFFNVYLSQMLGVKPSKIYIQKKKDTDSLFRYKTIELFDKYYDSFFRSLQPNDSIVFSGIVNLVINSAHDKSNLFQRSILYNCIADEFNLSHKESDFVTTLLNRAFAYANSDTSDATPISFVLNQLTGNWLSKLLKKSYRILYGLICGLSWQQVYELSQDNDWKLFVCYINAFISIVQDSTTKKYTLPIESYIKKLSLSISTFRFWKIVKDQAIDAVKQKMYSLGLISEAQNLDIMLDLYANCYAGRFRRLADVITATDMLATRITEKLDKEKNLYYLLGIAQQQKDKGYDIFI